MSRKFGPKKADHPSIGEACPACDTPFKEGDFTTLIALGPGGSKEEQKKCREGSAYNAVAAEVHWDCAGGGEERGEIR